MVSSTEETWIGFKIISINLKFVTDNILSSEFSSSVTIFKLSISFRGEYFSALLTLILKESSWRLQFIA